MGSGGNLSIGPGFAGFVAFFLMAVALWLLVRNMSSRLRRMAYQEREREAGLSDRDTTLGTAAGERSPGAEGATGTGGSPAPDGSDDPDAPAEGPDRRP